MGYLKNHLKNEHHSLVLQQIKDISPYTKSARECESESVVSISAEILLLMGNPLDSYYMVHGGHHFISNYPDGNPLFPN